MNEKCLVETSQEFINEQNQRSVMSHSVATTMSKGIKHTKHFDANDLKTIW